jgi:hypothetical protein
MTCPKNSTSNRHYDISMTSHITLRIPDKGYYIEVLCTFEQNTHHDDEQTSCRRFFHYQQRDEGKESHRSKSLSQANGFS